MSCSPAVHVPDQSQSAPSLQATCGDDDDPLLAASVITAHNDNPATVSNPHDGAS